MSQNSKTHRLTVTAMLSAVAVILMYLEFPLPFLIPPFIKMDFSELPALLASFSLGPGYGIAVCLIKNLIKCLSTTSGCIGELSNFLLGLCFVLPAGWLYRRKKNRRMALLGSLLGALCMALLCIPINYYLIYPVYTRLLPLETILQAYQQLRPEADGLLQCLLLFNAPFTLCKGLLDMGLAFAIYKPLSPLLHR